MFSVFVCLFMSYILLKVVPHSGHLLDITDNDWFLTSFSSYKIQNKSHDYKSAISNWQWWQYYGTQPRRRLSAGPGGWNLCALSSPSVYSSVWGAPLQCDFPEIPVKLKWTFCQITFLQPCCIYTGFEHNLVSHIVHWLAWSAHPDLLKLLWQMSHSVNLHVLLQIRVGRESFGTEFHFLFTGNVGKIFFCDKYFSGLWSEDAVTGTASMCPRGRLGVKPGTAYGASDRWRQSVLEASPPGGVLSPVVTGNSDSHSVHIAYDRDICCRPLLRDREVEVVPQTFPTCSKENDLFIECLTCFVCWLWSKLHILYLQVVGRPGRKEGRKEEVLVSS